MRRTDPQDGKQRKDAPPPVSIDGEKDGANEMDEMIRQDRQRMDCSTHRFNKLNARTRTGSETHKSGRKRTR